jgi:hypothetical protein
MRPHPVVPEAKRLHSLRNRSPFLKLDLLRHRFECPEESLDSSVLPPFETKAPLSPQGERRLVWGVGSQGDPVSAAFAIQLRLGSAGLTSVATGQTDLAIDHQTVWVFHQRIR